MEITDKGSAPAVAASSIRTELEVEMLEFFVRVAQLLGQPRSIGEIYGLLYLSPEPLSMDAIVRRLKISTGSASQGLKQLRGLRAVKTVYVPGERRDHYVAEEVLRKVVTGFIQEEIEPHIQSSRERIERMENLIDAIDDGSDKQHFHRCVKRLDRLQKLSRRLLPVLLRFVT